MRKEIKTICRIMIFIGILFPLFSFSQNTKDEFIGTLAIPGVLRDCPSIDCKIIGYYAETAKVKIIGLDDSNEWYQIDGDYYGNGWMHYSLFVDDYAEEGWVYKDFVPEDIKMKLENYKQTISQEEQITPSSLSEEGQPDPIDWVVLYYGIVVIFIAIIFSTLYLFRKKIKDIFRFKLNVITLPKIKLKQTRFATSLFIALVIMAGIIGISYGAVEYKKTSELIKTSNQLVKEEKYNEAIEKLQVAQVSFIVEKLTLNKQKISDEIEENKKLIIDKINYNQGIEQLNKQNYQGAIVLFSKIPEDSFYSNNAKLKTEESKRKIVEEELGETKIARKEAEEKTKQESIKRSQAEAKAKQEQFEKELKEQQLVDKEAEEKRMNADNDGDGLTYREELAKGTSDWNTDSDGDGIPDNLDTHPAGGGRNIPQTFAWSYGDYNWAWTESIQEDWYDYYKAKPRSSAESVEYITSDDPFIKKISKRISEGAKGDVNEVWLAVSFVQSLPYVKDVYTGYDEYPKYPVETFFEKNGDCEDSSYLVASIINAMNRGVILVLLPGHMAVGVYMDCNVAGTYYQLDGKCYYYVETTGEGWSAGEIPDEYRYTPATLIKIPSGETFSNISPQYKKPCDPSPDFSGYYYDGSNYYLDSQCNNLVYCLSYKELYYSYTTKSFYWDGSCSQLTVKGCYKSKTYPGYFYNSGSAWYYDSQCTQLYQSMSCNYPSILSYSCTSEYNYSSKKSTCDYYQSSKYLKDLVADCYQKLEQCKNDINEYQQKKSEYDQCRNKIEY